MRRLLLTVALLCGTAHAAPLCWPSSVGGSGTTHYTKRVVTDPGDPYGPDAGWAIWWHCIDPKAPSGWQSLMLACREGDLTYCLKSAPLQFVPAAMAAAWPASSPEQAGVEWVVAIAWEDFARATRPPLPAYKVTPYTGATYRATYPLVNGKRSTTSNGKVLIVTNGVPTPCSCPAGAAVEGSTTYCTVPAPPSSVANCTAVR